MCVKLRRQKNAGWIFWLAIFVFGAIAASVYNLITGFIKWQQSTKFGRDGTTFYYKTCWLKIRWIAGDQTIDQSTDQTIDPDRAAGQQLKCFCTSWRSYPPYRHLLAGLRWPPPSLHPSLQERAPTQPNPPSLRLRPSCPTVGRPLLSPLFALPLPPSAPWNMRILFPVISFTCRANSTLIR